MPYINVRITKDDVTKEQKTTLVKGITDLMQNVLGKNPATTFVVIDEIETDNWAVGGELITTIRERKSN